MKSICLVTCYMGPLPIYFDYYAASCKLNSDIDFVVVNDHVAESYTDKNIRYLKMDLEELNAFSTHQLNIKVNLKSPWKINELKPLFGNIFKDLLVGYDHWGWCDLDVIWGRLRHFLTDDLLNQYDVITSKKHWTAGHFTLFKNNSLCNNLYKRFAGVFDLLNDPAYYAFEECCHRWDGELFSIEYLKEKKLPVSMFDLVKWSEQNAELKAQFKDVIREHPQPINYTCKNGVLIDLNDNTEFMYYHLITVKKIWRFYIPPFKGGNLIITPYGIRSEKENKTTWYLQRAHYCYRGIKNSIKHQSTATLLKKLTRLKITGFFIFDV